MASSVPRVLLPACLCALSLLTAVPSRANPATADEGFAMRAQALEARVNDVREKNLRSKARMFLLGAALVGTRALARTPQEALAHAAKASPSPAPEPCPRSPAPLEGLRLCAAR